MFLPCENVSWCFSYTSFVFEVSALVAGVCWKRQRPYTGLVLKASSLLLKLRGLSIGFKISLCFGVLFTKIRVKIPLCLDSREDFILLLFF